MDSDLIPQFEPSQDEQFRRNLFTSTPVAFVTPLLIGINVLVFIAMVASGLSITSPTNEGLIRWGADFGPLATHGQWWRLITAAFVHIGIIHVAMNMWVLYGAGIFTERLFGNISFLVLYLLSGLGGSVASLMWQPHVVSAGASGAVFGVYGALLGFLLVQRNTIPAERLKGLLQSAGMFIAFNLFYGFTAAQVDMAAHIGGFATGFLTGCALAQPLVPVNAAGRAMRALIVGVCGAALLALAASRLPVVDDLAAELGKFDDVENQLFKEYIAAADKLNKHELSSDQFADLVTQKLVPPFREELSRLTRMRFATRQRDAETKINQYLSLRAEGWTMIAEGVRRGDNAVIAAGKAKAQEADTIVSKGQ